MSISKLEKVFSSSEASDTIALSESFNLSLDFTTGSGVGTVVLQRSFDKGVSWKTTDSFTSDKESNGEAKANLLWRLNCTAYTSGSISCILEQ
jgi:hypothetical protein